jgi:hypothetical protein
VLADSPEWLLHLGHGKHDPAIDLRSFVLSARYSTIAADSGMTVTVDQHRNLARWIETQEVRMLMLTG